MSPIIEIPFPFPLRSRIRSCVFGLILGSIATFISLILTIISSAFGSSRASPILGCPQPKPSKKIRMLSALFSLNMDLISSRASSVIFMVIPSSSFYHIFILIKLADPIHLLTCISKPFNTPADFISYTPEECPFFLICSLSFGWIIKSPMFSFYTWWCYRTFVSCVTA